MIGRCEDKLGRQAALLHLEPAFHAFDQLGAGRLGSDTVKRLGDKSSRNPACHIVDVVDVSAIAVLGGTGDHVAGALRCCAGGREAGDEVVVLACTLADRLIDGRSAEICDCKRRNVDAVLLHSLEDELCSRRNTMDCDEIRLGLKQREHLRSCIGSDHLDWN